MNSASRPASAWIRLALALVMLGACAVYAATHLRVTTSLSHFVRSPEERRAGDIAARMTHSAGARTMIFVLEGATLTAGLAAAAELADTLGSEPEVASLRTSIDPEIGETFWNLVYPRRFGFAASDPARMLPARLSDAGLERMAQDLRTALGGPTGVLAKRIAPGDPWLFFADRLRALTRMRVGGMMVAGERLVTADRQAAVVLLETRHSPFEVDHQRPLDDAIERTVAEIEAFHGVTIERSAIHRLAVHSQRTIEADVKRISVVSTLAVVALLLVLYRSPTLVVLAGVPLGCGLSTGAAACAALFGEVHGISVAFGATLIGVAIDYPLHLFTHHRLGGGDGWATVRRIKPALRLGAATTVIAFAAIGFAAMPGVREIGVFAAVGVTTALVVTLHVLPAWLPENRKPGIVDRVARAATGLLARAERRRRVCGAVVLAALIACVVLLPGAEWVDDAAALNRLEPTALAEDDRVRERVTRLDVGRVVVALGRDDEAALVANDEVAVRLGQVRSAGQHVVSLSDLLWSADLQRRNHAEFSAAPDLANRVADALAQAGFRPETFAAATDDLARRVEPLTLKTLLESRLAGLAEPFVLPRLEADDPAAIVTYVRGFELEALDAALRTMEGVVVFDQRSLSSAVYRRYRRRIAVAVGIGLGLVCGVLGFRYRRVGAVATAVAPALLAVATTVAITVAIGETLHLMHVVALLLVLGIGVDYGIFLVERSRGGDPLGAVLVSLGAAWATTLGAFALLATSANPALHALGTTVGIGVTLSLILGPAFLVGLRRRG